MKKLLVLMLILTLALSLAACGGTDENAKAPEQTPEEKLAEEQERANQDYDTLGEFLKKVAVADEAIYAYLELPREEDVLVAAAEENLAYAQSLAAEFSELKLQTEYYNEHLGYTGAVVESLNSFWTIIYENAYETDNEEIMEEAAGYLEDYKANFDALLTLFGV